MFFSIKNCLNIFIIGVNLITIASGCTSFFCINQCGNQENKKNSGYKLILANNRDEDIHRPTWPANTWPPKEGQINGELKCDQSRDKKPFDLCVYGALDVKDGQAPDYYSTWLGINERGSVGNLLFFMTGRPHTSKVDYLRRGNIVGNYIQNSSWPNVEEYMEALSNQRYRYKPFNYVQAEISQTTGDYDLYYVNNNSSKTYEKLNMETDKPYVFGISNSDPERPFLKVVNGERKFSEIINETPKEKLVDSLMTLLQNTSSNMPDEMLTKFMRSPGENVVDGVSRLKANYSNYWKNGFTRTSTLILVDYEDNVEYFEYNLTRSDALKDEWKMNSFTFKLRPLYKEKNAAYVSKISGICLLLNLLGFLLVH